ncbi:hypothetical protein DM01DRAFT_1305742 [Hesseltinella vesiculosa]|uniref:Uncharacterized protein n=1 Tax=Hesseltinella vesiculosa TaxID=101127 RepID=A0A1X2GGZ8_9FUNG|nr:hypothetical protein DM01DRAFT_1305742 [Hesseltinella vesiculosa]
MYVQKKVTPNEIFALAIQHTNKFNEKSMLSFSKWCFKHNVAFTTVEYERKQPKDTQHQKVRYRLLWTLKDEYVDAFALGITEHLPRYRAYIHRLKEEGYAIFGYARKSPGAANKTKRILLLQKMVDRLINTLMVDKVFVSLSSIASDSLSVRDAKNGNMALAPFNNVTGDTQDLLSFIKVTENVCLVALDFAGLSTNPSDIVALIKENGNIQKIIIDLSSSGKHVKYFHRKDILEHPDVLQEFDCRHAYPKRSTEI